MKSDFITFVTIDELSKDRKPAPVINGTMIIFVTIGVPFSSIPIMQKVSCFVDLEVDTTIKVAKRLRNMVADHIEEYGWVKGTAFNPSELYYEIYENVTDTIPLYCSSQAPALRFDA